MKTKIPFFCLLSIFIGFIALSIIIEHSLIIVHSQQFQGEIVGFKKKGQTSSNTVNRSLYPVVKFKDQNGFERKITANNAMFLFKTHEIGASTNILYNKQSDKLLVNNFHSLWFQAVFLLALSGGICYFGRKFQLK